ncbi:MAG: HRDC domain-containing protein [Proteobacteria bacterium]|nr:ribonuclease D [Desulfobacula sp.]MBU4133205.1 HRDC domain-containing protein [Pseudomonadota bacterium]
MLNFKFIESDGELETVCKGLAREKIIGVDLEADSMHCFKEKVCLIQIAGSDQAFLVDPFLINDFSPFIRLLENQDIVKIFHGADFDVRSLDREMGVRIENLFDTEIACRFLNVRERGLGALLKEHFNVYVDKKFQKVDWSRRPLKEDMVAYSVGDVAHLIALHDRIKERLEKMNRFSWAKEEFEAQASVKYESNHQLPLFKKFKGAGKMDNRSLAVLENLLQVRMDIAEKKDLPLFKIMSSQSLMILATHRPKAVETMISIKALSKKQADMYGHLCQEAISSALALAHGELPSYPKTRMPKKNPQVLERIDLLKKMRDKLSISIGMEPGFLINNTLISAIAFENPGTLAALGNMENIRNWQLEALGEDILKTLGH